ncbi:hypothetical protein SUGI_0734160 [Cryptomeria japonica]|nr:hypothetical protein SUGI_0734160 [Cryptomeria japonica]
MASTYTHAFEEVAPAASTSGRHTKPPYDVFINHRGPDVKHTLAAALYKTLTGIRLRVFLDSEELQLGSFLPREIEEAMRSASLHLVIFSQNYAQSPWCLAELSFMLKTGVQIIPIFYYIQPDEVRYAKGVYAEALDRHKKKGRYSLRKLEEWKNALNNVSYNVGHIISNKDDEESLLKNILNCVLRVIKNVPFVVAKHPVGLEEAVLDFERTTLQSAESYCNAQIVGIWGMGGSGKTTLAKQLYNNKYRAMESSSFLLEVKNASSRNLLHEKQKKLMEDLGLPYVFVENIEEGKGVLASRLRSVQALIVLDDVDTIDQLDALVPEKDSLGRGSLIVVTTREREVLQGWGISSIYKMKPLDSPHAKQLFCWHAFLQPSPLPEFEDLVENFLSACNGLPLSLKIFGAQLYCNFSKDYWKSQLHKISRILDKNIKKKLKVSYDALDEEEKQIFLDSACFFIGEKKSWAIAVWDGSGWSGLHSWERLLNKCLIELDDRDCIKMHDHFRDLGREIANKKLPYRLSSPQQIVNIDNAAQVRGNYFNQVIGDKSRDLVWLRWFDHGQRNLHSLSLLKNLRVLELNEEGNPEKHLEELWETDSEGPVQLRELFIHGSPKFRRFPKSIGRLIYLKKIVLSCGTKMKSLPESFCRLRSLEQLELCWCLELSSLPSSFGNLRNLRHLDLSYCKKLRVLPDSFNKLTLLQHLCLEECSELVLELGLLEKMTKVEYLNLLGCKELKVLPHHLTNQTSLRELDLRRTSIREIPMNISQPSKLQKFYVGNKLLTSLPTTLGDLSSLTALTIEGCSGLEFLPESVGRLSLLETLKIWDSGLESLPKSLRQLNNLQTLEISGCPISNLDLICLPRELDLNSKPTVSLCNLKHIDLFSTKVCKISFSEDCCPALETLKLQINEHLTEIDVLPTTIKELELFSCKMMMNISGIAGLVNIQILIISNCPKLDALPSFAQFASLKRFELRGCYGVKKIQGLEHCRAVEMLKVDTMWEEAGIESLERMERLRSLHLRVLSRSAIEGCIQSMQKWPEDMKVYWPEVQVERALVRVGEERVVDVFHGLEYFKSIYELKYSN